MRQFWIALAVSCTVLAVFAAPAQSEAPVEIEPPMRDLWERGAKRFHRQWLIAGPLSAERVAAVAAETLQPAAGKPLGDRTGDVRWRPHTSWGDVVNLNDVVEAGPANRYAYVAATLVRKHEGPVDLLIGTQGPVTVWLNGERVHERADSRAGFVRDSDRIAVNVKEGENSLVLLLRSAEADAWHLTARAVASGALSDRVDELAPIVLENSSATLRVKTHLTDEPSAAPVEVQALAAGGRVQARANAPRGEALQFDTGSWPEGAYDLRFATKTAWGQARYAYLPWYKGDAIAAAKALVEASHAAADDPEGAHVRLLAAIVRDRVGEQFERVKPRSWTNLHAVLMEYEEWQLDRAQQVGSTRANGFVRIAYTDEIDGSVQFCRAYLPVDYASSRRWPLVIQLHGYNPANPPYQGWWSIDQRHNDMADRKGVIFVEPHGRGNAQYRGLGEQDVLRCLELAKQRFAVDDDRVYLTGESMGGHGTWSIASRNPELFAAAAPVYGGWDLRVTSVAGPPAPDAEPKSASAFFHQERSSSFANAENLLNVPLYVVHGDADAAVIVENSRHAVRMLERWGYDIRYHEMPGWTHEDLNRREDIVDWLLTHRRNSAPKHVRVRSPDLAGAHAHWLRVQAARVPERIIRVDAEVVAPGLVSVDSENVAQFTLALPDALRGEREEIEVVWNGESRAARIREGVASVSLTTERAARLHKRAGLEGPISDIVNTPFLVVVGTSSKDPQMRKFCRDRAEDLQAIWSHWQHQPLRILDDTEVTAAHEQAYSLILLGGADANAVTRRLAGRLPAKVANGTIEVDGRRWKAPDAVLQMIYPSPVAADRYVLLVAATSAAGMYQWRPQLIEPSVGYGLVGSDWTIQDGRRPPPGAAVDAVDRSIASGMFDVNWRYGDAWTTQGDAVRRASWPVRSAPAPDSVPSVDALQEYAGDYEFPQFIVKVSLDDGALHVHVPDGSVWGLIADGSGSFRVAGSREFVYVVRDAEGAVAGVEVDTQGRTLYGVRK